MKIKKVLITGVAGFIGSNLLDFLMEHTDWEITGIDNLSTGSEKNISLHYSQKRFHFIKSSCTGLGSLKEFDCIFHLAALPRIQPSFDSVNEHLEANLLSGTFLLEMMIRENHYPRFVYSGSSAIYGNPERFPTPEKEPVRCLNPYAFQKYELEVYLEILSSRYPIDYVTLRYFNPYGPGSYNPENKFNAYSSVVGIFLNRKEQGKALKVTGDGSQSRDFIHVLDVANANYLAAVHQGKLNTAFNIGIGTSLKIIDLAKMISPDIEFVSRRAGEAERTCADISKAAGMLGWKPKLTLNDYFKSI